MSIHLWRRLHLSVIANMLLLLALTPLPALARSATRSPSLPRARSGWVAVIPRAVPMGTAHFLYVDDGNPVQDGIMGYRITRAGLAITPGSPYLTGGLGGGDGFGINVIATSTAYGACLYHSDAGDNGLSGQVESFMVNRTTGALTKVSIVPLPYTYTTAGDTQVSADGRYVYVATYPVLLGGFSLDILTVGSGCTLQLANTILPVNSYFSIALVGRDGLLGAGATTLDMYCITNGAQLILLTSTPSQIVPPMGAASAQEKGRTCIFNGGGLTYNPSELEAHTVNGQGMLGNVPGSPAVDVQAKAGAVVWFDPLHRQVIESEGNDNILSIFEMKGGR
jgi:hypothetical protein